MYFKVLEYFVACIEMSFGGSFFFSFFSFFFFFFCLFKDALAAYESSQAGVELELQLPAYTTAIETQDQATSATYT